MREKEGEGVFVSMPAITMFTSERIAAEHGVTIKHYHAAPMDSSNKSYSQSKWSSASEVFPPMLQIQYRYLFGTRYDERFGLACTFSFTDIRAGHGHTGRALYVCTRICSAMDWWSKVPLRPSSFTCSPNIPIAVLGPHPSTPPGQGLHLCTMAIKALIIGSEIPLKTENLGGFGKIDQRSFSAGSCS